MLVIRISFSQGSGMVHLYC